MISIMDAKFGKKKNIGGDFMTVLYQTNKRGYDVKFESKNNIIVGYVSLKGSNSKPYNYFKINDDLNIHMTTSLPSAILTPIFSSHANYAIDEALDKKVVEKYKANIQKSNYSSFWDYCSKHVK